MLFLPSALKPLFKMGEDFDIEENMQIMRELGMNFLIELKKN